jgi:hypothetical protein
MTVWVLGPADHAYPSTPAPDQPVTAILLHAARNATEAAQLLVRADAALSGVAVTAGALTGPDGATLAATAVTVRPEYAHRSVQVISGDAQQPPGGGGYYDALLRPGTADVAAGTTGAFHLSVRVPPDQPPGTYTGTVTVAASGADGVALPVTLTVYDVVLPAANASTLKVNNWFGSAGWDYQGTIRAIPLQYGVTEYDDHWWTVIGNIAANHARHRNSVIHADFTALLMPHTTLDANGTYHFGWDSFDRFVQLFADAGALHLIYTPHQIRPGPTVNIVGRVGGGVGYVAAQPNSDAANNYFDQVFPALRSHLDAKGWTDVFYFSALDEPNSQAALDAASWLYGRYRQHFPAPHTNEAHAVLATAVEPNLTTLTPLISLYHDHIAHYQGQRLAGKELWLYNCIVPQGYYLNRFLSYHLAKTRLTPWLLWQLGATGYLHWGWSYWVSGSDDDWSAADTFAGSQTGDAWLVRPDKARYDILDSVRSEAQLAGIEDYELLTQLARTKPVAASAIANSLVTSTVAYNRLGSAVQDRHRQLLVELTAGTADARFPVTESFAGGDQGWTHSQGSWSVSGGGYQQSDLSAWGITAAARGRAYGTVAMGCTVQITGVNTDDGGDNNWAGVVVRSAQAADMDTGYLVGIRNTGQVFVYRTGTTLATAAVPGYAAGRPTRLHVLAQGSRITVYAGSATGPLLTVDNTAYRVGSAALVTGKAAATFSAVTLNAEQNYAEAKPVTASSSYTADGWSPYGAVDGRRGPLGFSSGANASIADAEWVAVDLGASYPVSRVDLYARSDGGNTGLGFPADFTVETSVDGAQWTAATSRTGYPRPDAGVQAFAFPTVTARHVRVRATALTADPSGQFFLQLAQFEVYGGNLAAGRAVTASSSVSDPVTGWLPAAATDGFRQSTLGFSMGWSSAGGAGADRTEWLSVDLGGASLVSRVDLYPRSDGVNTGLCFPADFTVEISVDGAQWTEVVRRTGYQRPTGPQRFTFDATTARYVRITGTTLTADPTGTYYLQFAEVEVR